MDKVRWKSKQQQISTVICGHIKILACWFEWALPVVLFVREPIFSCACSIPLGIAMFVCRWVHHFGPRINYLNNCWIKFVQRFVVPRGYSLFTWANTYLSSSVALRLTFVVLRRIAVSSYWIACHGFFFFFLHKFMSPSGLIVLQNLPLQNLASNVFV